MFAYKSRIANAFRVLLTAVILFNALMPTVALAKSSTSQSDFANAPVSQNEGKQSTNKIVLPTENNIQRQNFSRPISRVGEMAKPSDNSVMQTSTVLLQCDPISSTFAFTPGMYGSPICPDQPPGISLTETFVKDEGLYSPAGGFMRFRILCQGNDCDAPKIYYRASMDATYNDRFPDGITWGAKLYMNVYADSEMTVTQGMQNGVCGVGQSGSCHFEIVGVIPNDIHFTKPCGF